MYLVLVWAVNGFHVDSQLVFSCLKVQLGEDRGRLVDRRADGQRTSFPGGRRGVVAGDDRVAGTAVEVVDLVDARIGAMSPAPPKMASTALAENGRKGASTRLRSETRW